MLQAVSCTLFPSAAALSTLPSMFFASSLLLSLVLAANAVNVIVSNDDGWAEKNIRSVYHVRSPAPC